MQNELKILSIINDIRKIFQIEYTDGEIDNMIDIKKSFRNIDRLSTEIIHKKYSKFEKSIIGGFIYGIFKLDKLNIQIKKDRKYIEDRKKQIINNINNIKRINFLTNNGHVYIYLKNGKIHNENGYAIRYLVIDKFSKYFINDKNVSYDDWMNYRRKIKLNRIIRK